MPTVRQNARPTLRKLSSGQVREMRKALAEGVSKSQLCREYGVSLGAIDAIAKWETYRDVFPVAEREKGE